MADVDHQVFFVLALVAEARFSQPCVRIKPLFQAGTYLLWPHGRRSQTVLVWYCSSYVYSGSTQSICYSIADLINIASEIMHNCILLSNLKPADDIKATEAVLTPLLF
jgi:hypothetical protein